jgi:hypothetical protein
MATFFLPPNKQNQENYAKIKAFKLWAISFKDKDVLYESC